jgi:hypothetical protein
MVAWGLTELLPHPTTSDVITASHAAADQVPPTQARAALALPLRRTGTLSHTPPRWSQHRTGPSGTKVAISPRIEDRFQPQVDDDNCRAP